MEKIDIIARGMALKSAKQIDTIIPAWETWTPVLTWTTAIPAGIVTVAKYKVIGKTCFFELCINATDGLGATKIEHDLPIVPKINNMLPSVIANTRVGATWNSRAGWITDDGSNKVSCYFTATSAQTLRFGSCGFYEID